MENEKTMDIGDILTDDPHWDGMDGLEAYKSQISPIISAYPSAMQYFNNFDLFDKNYKLLVFQCPKCGGFYLYDSKGHDGCLDCGYVETEKQKIMEDKMKKVISAAKPVCYHCGKDLEPYNPQCPHCGKMRYGYGKADKRRKGYDNGKRERTERK